MNALAKKATLAVSAVLFSGGVVSGELGANRREITDKKGYTVAVAEISTNNQWVELPNESKVSARDMRKFTARNNSISAQVNALLQSRLEHKFADINAEY